MWNSRHLIKIKIHSGKVRFTIPLPLFIGLQLFDYLEDLLSIIEVFAPRRIITIHHKAYPIKDTIKMIRKMIGAVYSVKYCEPFDLVDLQSGKDVIKISIW
ncbi:hypothetical protein HZI73_22710 [Vallitalea pronyensis]|uniref:Uncharacterized protein n=1 Tax=Vallitalea pronyensis TaxID=1348613 RepID=A0A8J8SIH2_9FIRM|nr:hypothetical protein [Vallitalea pronyensis]QUI24925.1 hypothetical protein HZI73_22710 [Vallitalea pronyensis]